MNFIKIETNDQPMSYRKLNGFKHFFNKIIQFKIKAKRIRSAAKLMFENVVPMIGGQIADPDDCGELIISCTVKEKG